MSRLIDADALKQKINTVFWTEIEKIIDSMPTIDAVPIEHINLMNLVEVVRCKECKWKAEDNSCDLNCRIDYLDGTETDMWFYVNDDDYCSYGEREGE